MIYVVIGSCTQYKVDVGHVAHGRTEIPDFCGKTSLDCDPTTVAYGFFSADYLHTWIGGIDGLTSTSI
jgi:hypothetical protein